MVLDELWRWGGTLLTDVAGPGDELWIVCGAGFLISGTGGSPAASWRPAIVHRLDGGDQESEEGHRGGQDGGGLHVSGKFGWWVRKLF